MDKEAGVYEEHLQLWSQRDMIAEWDFNRVMLGLLWKSTGGNST